MKYDQFRYLWPPRPTTTIKPKSEHYEKMKARSGWAAQYKFNGQRNVIYISPDGDVQWWNRHKEQHRNYDVPDWLNDQILSVVKPNGKWMVIDGELMHAKDKNIKHTLYWWDLLVCDNKFLLGTSTRDRFNLLCERTTDPIGTFVDQGHDLADKLSDNILRARNMEDPAQWDVAWDATELSYVEGFVFKNLNPQARLGVCIAEKNNNGWMVRCRKEHKGYNF